MCTACDLHTATILVRVARELILRRAVSFSLRSSKRLYKYLCFDGGSFEFRAGSAPIVVTCSCQCAAGLDPALNDVL
jgi:hypothetical protein